MSLDIEFWSENFLWQVTFRVEEIFEFFVIVAVLSLFDVAASPPPKHLQILWRERGRRYQYYYIRLHDPDKPSIVILLAAANGL